MDLPEFDAIVEAAVRRAMLAYHRQAHGGLARRTRRDPRPGWRLGREPRR